MLYALLEKFGDDISKRKFKKVFTMTEIGKMIRDEGIKEGLEEGLQKGKIEGKADILLKQLLKKFGKVPDEYEQKIRSLSNDSIDIIATEIFDMKDIKDLDRYL